MSNIINEAVKDEFVRRINSVKESSQRQWGKMSVCGMLCHVADQIRLAVGEVSCKPMSNIVTRTLVKKLVLMGMPAPKGKLKTAPEIDAEIDGTKSVGFEGDIKALLDVIDRFMATDEDMTMPVHPVFGKMNRTEWGRLIYIHLDFHLKQFGH